MRAALFALAMCAAFPVNAAIDDEALAPPFQTPPRPDNCKPLIDIIASTLSDGIRYEALPFALVGDLNTIYNALPPRSRDAFDGAIAGVSETATVIMLTRGLDVCGTMPPIPAAAWAVLHKRIFGVMA